MAHLAGQDTAAAQLLRGDPAEELDALPSHASPSDDAFTVDGLNAYLVNNRSGAPLPRGPHDVGAGRGGDARVRVRLSEDAWRDERFPWLLGAIAARYLVQSRVVEWWVHGEDIRATTGARPADPALARSS